MPLTPSGLLNHPSPSRPKLKQRLAGALLAGIVLGGAALQPTGRAEKQGPTPAALAAQLSRLEAEIRDPRTPEADLATLGYQQQRLYRSLAKQPALSTAVLQALPGRWQPVARHHLAARRAFLAMHRGPRSSQLPAWRIVAPAPADQLLRHYRQASAATGIPWEVLAAVNLVESAMGRIDGISVANARGPMQFLPSTWVERGIGKGGDIRNPRDAIHAAARYLVRRGGLRDIRRGLWGYNNSDHYGRGVLEYAALLRDDPAAYRGLYHWQVVVATSAGDIWLPLGYSQSKPISVQEALRRKLGTPAEAP